MVVTRQPRGYHKSVGSYVDINELLPSGSLARVRATIHSYNSSPVPQGQATELSRLEGKPTVLDDKYYAIVLS